MPTPEIHEIKHKVLDKDVEDLKLHSKEHTDRIINLEKSDLITNEQLRNAVTSIDSLVQWIKWALGIGVVGYVSFFAWLMQQQIVK